MITHTIQVVFTRGSDAPITGTIATVNDSEMNYDLAFTTSESAHLQDFVAAKADMKSIFMLADHDCHCHSNTSGGTVEITLKANVPYVWTSASGLANPFSVDLTKLYWDNEYAGATALQFRMLLDQS